MSASKFKLNTQVYDEASEWLVTFRTGEPDPQQRQQLDEWLRRSPEHVRAYLELSALWEDTALHDAQRQVTSEMHITRARCEDNVVSLGAATTAVQPEQQPSSKPPRHYRHFGIAASVLLVCTVAVAWMQIAKDTYATDIGEKRTITLPDGSSVELNSRSRVRVKFTAAERAIELLAGQALFHAVEDRNRPFLVNSDGTWVRAVGTRFDVYKRKDGTRVTVVEGRVAVSSLLLSEGEQVTVPTGAARGELHAARANIGAATAWTQGRLVFDSAPLSQVAEEFNRYNHRQLVITDPALRDFAVVGVFSSADPASLLRFLRAQPGMAVIEDRRQISIAARADAP